MFKHIEFEIEGVPPGCMMHNGRLANPLDPIAKEMKKIHSISAKKKTDKNLEDLLRLEWYGSIYTNTDGRVIWPGQNIEAMFREAGKQRKLGKAFQGGFFCPEDPLLIYDGPKNIDELWERGKNLDVRGAKPTRGTVQRARVIFDKWGLVFKIAYNPEILNESAVLEAIDYASTMIGLSDYRPKFGRFTVLSFKKLD